MKSTTAKLKHKYTLAAIERYIKKMPTLKFCEEYDKFEDDPVEYVDSKIRFTAVTLKANLKKFFTYNDRYGTIDKDTADYTDAHHNRTITDIYRVLLSYLPKIKFKELYDAICELSDDRWLGSMICSDIEKRVYYRELGGRSGYFNGAPTDEYGIDWRGRNREPVDIKYDGNTSLRRLRYVEIKMEDKKVNKRR